MATLLNRLTLMASALAVTCLIPPRLAAQPVTAPAQSPPAVTVSVPVSDPQPQPQPRIYLSADGTTIYLIGSILGGSFKRFDAVLLGAPKARTLFLSSPGGLTIEARLIAAEVRKRGLATYVEQYCASACTQIFVAGRERIIGREAALGFHQAVGLDLRGNPTRSNPATDRTLMPTVVFALNGNDTLRLAYELAGLDKTFIAKVLTKSHDDMWNPTVEELTAARVITRQATGRELELPAGSTTRAELRAKLAARPLWQRAAQLYPAAYEAGFDSAWRLGNSGTALELAISSGRAMLIVAMMGRVARGNDDLIARHLELYAQEAVRQSQAGYPACQTSMENSDLPANGVEAAFERTEDLLLLEATKGSPAKAAMSRAQATKILKNDIVPQLPSSFASGNSCKLGFQFIAAANKLRGTKRISAYRALLSLPDALGL